MQTIKFYLVPSLKAMLNGKATQLEINLVIKFAHQFAVTRLSQLVTNRKVYLDIYPHNLNTIALDCIAEMFERDEKNNFIELIQYFQNKNIAELYDEEIISSFRTLVFSKLNDRIYRIYNERDPVLGKIIRNIKLIVKKENSVYKFQRFGTTYLALCGEEERDYQLPEFQIEELQSEVTLLLKGNENFKRFINRFFSDHRHLIAEVLKVVPFGLLYQSVSICKKENSFFNSGFPKTVNNVISN